MINDKVYCAIVNKNIKELKNLLKMGDNVVEIAISSAVKTGSVEVLKFILSTKFFNNEFVVEKKLMDAVYYDRVEMVKYLVEELKADIEYENCDPLFLANRLNHLELVKYFVVEKGQNIDLVLGDTECHENIRKWANQYRNTQNLKNKLEQELCKSVENKSSLKIKM